MAQRLSVDRLTPTLCYFVHTSAGLVYDRCRGFDVLYRGSLLHEILSIIFT
jgi:hypothetical protein